MYFQRNQKGLVYSAEEELVDKIIRVPVGAQTFLHQRPPEVSPLAFLYTAPWLISEVAADTWLIAIMS